MQFLRLLILIVAGTMCCSQAWAYFGPGMAVGAAATIVGMALGFVLLLVGLIWYPIKRLRAKFRRPPSVSHQKQRAE